MSDPFITVTVDDGQLRARLAAMPEKARQALIRAVKASAIAVQAGVQDKLAGPVLKERSHRLHDSIHYQVDDSPTAVTGQVGTDVRYAYVHEYGGTFQIPAHMRRQTKAWGKPITARDVLVRAHQATYPKRSFLRSTLTEQTPAIVERMTSAVRQAAGEST